MITVVGRDHELREIKRVLTDAFQGSVAVSVRAGGTSGIGKTALFEAAMAQAREAGWLCARATCHRIQAHVPGSGATHIVRALIEAAGKESMRYTAGIADAVDQALAGTLTGAPLHQTLLRLLEGLLVDHAVLIAVDDAQWIDAESGETLEQVQAAFSTRRLAFFRLERAEEARSYQFAQADESFILQPLPAGPATAIALQHYPGAPESVVASIVTHGGGHPVDIVALSTAARENGVRDAAEIEGSLRAAVARQLNRLDPAVREFLQICALIAEPVEYGTLAQMWPDESVLNRLINSVSGRFLVQSGNGIRFVHQAIAESVRHTLAIEIPFRRRILSALIAAGCQTLEDCERIVEQAAACGDKQLERTYLLKLAGEATKRSALSAAAAAYRRALQISPPAPEDFISFYSQYAGVLMMHSHMAEARELILGALRSAGEAGVEQGLGALANILIIATSRTSGRGPALEIADYYLRRHRSPGDRVFLLSGAAWLQSCRLDSAAFSELKSELYSLGVPVPEVIEMRMCIAEAFLQTRLGNYSEATLLIDRAAAQMTSVPSALRSMVDVGRASIETLQYGGRQFEDRIAPIAQQYASDNRQASFIEYLKALITMGKGDLRGAHEIAAEMLSQRIDLPDRQRLLGVAAATAAWQNEESEATALIEEQVHAFFLDDRSDIVVPVAAWWSAVIASRRPTEARELLERVIPRLRDPFDVDTLLFPIAAVLAAVRIGSPDLIKRALQEIQASPDCSPWQRAQNGLAASFAREMLSPGTARDELADLARHFDELAQPFYSAIARTIADPRNETAAAFLRSSGVRAFRPLREDGGSSAKAKGAPALQAHPSKRELEIIALVADGKTNRQMAEALFLSERTIEAHLSNIFNKLGVSSRTKVAAWYLSSTAAG